MEDEEQGFALQQQHQNIHLWSRCSKTQVDHHWDSSLTAGPCSSCFQGLPRATWSPGDAWHPVAASSQSLSYLHGKNLKAVEITVLIVIYTADYFRAKLGAEIFFRFKRCTKQDLLRTNYREEMWGGELEWFLSSFSFGFYFSPTHINKLLAQKISDLDQPHTHGHFCSHFYMLRHYRKQITRSVFI